MFIGLKILCAIAIIASIFFYLACIIATQKFFRTSDKTPTDYTPPVSILVPACGLDPGAEANWSSLCEQDYPQYEVLFGLRDTDDPAIPLLEKLTAKYPHTRFFSGLSPRGINHKDSTLSYLLETAQYETLIFVDSDIRVHSQYIRTAIAPLADPNVGLVTCAFTGRNPQSLGAAMAAFGRCFDFIPSALLARWLDGGVKFAVGVTMATRSSTLNASGGLHLNRIGSDYNLGKRIAQAGYRVELSRYVLESDTGTETLGAVYQRELRWARTIRYNRGAQYYTIALCYGTLYGLPLLFLTHFAPWSVGLMGLTWLCRLWQVILAAERMQAQALLLWLWALPLRELLSFGVWLLGAYGDRVYWRGRWLRISEDGIISPVEFS
ncbi:MAG: glycosyltransferase [Jaaginema sp. PMC 1079.18]|nr:glycosyltransferase [Jaaginema sp. PMC 1080.18]MEC4852217.1 glycosyltransferase [Jaaginema sp. PMC 1079.18]MEC4864825.1 glycosyltransferase [Jaaginema sp. PMC 1078.18]